MPGMFTSVIKTSILVSAYVFQSLEPCFRGDHIATDVFEHTRNGLQNVGIIVNQKNYAAHYK